MYLFSKEFIDRESAFTNFRIFQKSRILRIFKMSFKIRNAMNLILICISFIVQQITLIYLPNVICQSLIGTKAMLAHC